MVQYGFSEGLKATTGLDDDTANMVVMPLSEAVGMMAVDLALPTVATTTSTAAAGGTTAAATTGAGATVVSGAVGGLARRYRSNQKVSRPTSPKTTLRSKLHGDGHWHDHQLNAP